MLCAGLLLAACAPHKTAPKAESFPVVVPFALDRAGSKVTVEFELPKALDPHFKEPVLRPVFVGVRKVGIKKRGHRPTEQEFQAWSQQRDYLKQEPVPVRLTLLRWEQGQWQSASLHTPHDNIVNGTVGVRYEPIAADGIVPRLRPVSPDYMELIGSGQVQEDRDYDVYQLARIVPPTPGRYRLEVESLQDHPTVRVLSFELLISHHYRYGIK